MAPSTGASGTVPAMNGGRRFDAEEGSPPPTPFRIRRIDRPLRAFRLSAIGFLPAATICRASSARWRASAGAATSRRAHQNRIMPIRGNAYTHYIYCGERGAALRLPNRPPLTQTRHWRHVEPNGEGGSGPGMAMSSAPGRLNLQNRAVIEGTNLTNACGAASRARIPAPKAGAPRERSPPRSNRNARTAYYPLPRSAPRAAAAVTPLTTQPLRLEFREQFGHARFNISGKLCHLDLAVVVRIALMQRLHQRVGEHAVALVPLVGRFPATPPSAPAGPSLRAAAPPPPPTPAPRCATSYSRWSARRIRRCRAG